MPKYHVAYLYALLFAILSKVADGEVFPGLWALIAFIATILGLYYSFVEPTDRI